MKFTIELDEKQMHVMRKALENYARMGMGQLDVSVEEFCRNYFYSDYYEKPASKVVLPTNHGEVVKYHVDEIKDLVFGHPPNGSWSISNERVPEDCREAWDICQVVRKATAELRHERMEAAGKKMHKGVDMGPYMATNPKLPPVKVTRQLTQEEMQTRAWEDYRNGEYKELLEKHGCAGPDDLDKALESKAVIVEADPDDPDDYPILLGDHVLHTIAAQEAYRARRENT